MPFVTTGRNGGTCKTQNYHRTDACSRVPADRNREVDQAFCDLRGLRPCAVCCTPMTAVATN